MRGREHGCVHVCLLGPGTRRRYAICVFAPRVPLPGYLCVLTHATPRLATWHDMVTYLRSWWRCVACLLFVCMRRHTFCPLSLPFASYISGRALVRWAVGTSRLRSVAWQHTWTPLVTCVCLVFFFFFFWGAFGRVSGPASTCVWAVGMAQTQGTVPVGGQRRWRQWVRQSMANPRW